MKGKEPLRDHEIDALFERARANDPAPSAALVERVLADADAAMADRRRAARPGLRRRIAGLFSPLGGWQTAGGLVAATVVGIWIGFAAPDLVEGLLPGAVLAEDGLDDAGATFLTLMGEV